MRVSQAFYLGTEKWVFGFVCFCLALLCHAFLPWPHFFFTETFLMLRNRFLHVAWREDGVEVVTVESHRGGG